MATFDKHTSNNGKITHRVRIRMKGCPLQTASFDRLTDARRWAQQTESAIREGRYFKTREAQRHTLAELIGRYIADVLPSQKDSVHRQRQLAWWREQLGAYALADLAPPLIAEYRDRLAAGFPGDTPRSPATVVRYLAALSHCLTIGVKEYRWLDDSPMRKVTKPREPRGRVRFLSDEERAALLSACEASPNPYLFPVVVLALSTGMRAGEIMALEWRDVDLQRGWLTLRETKNGERRGVPLAGKALELLKQHGKVRRLDTPLLFPGNNPGKPVDLRAPWLAALKRAGIEDFRFHDLRHSAASYLAMNGASLNEIAAVLGHKTLSMVQRYAHLSESHKSGVVERMNAAIFGA
ncbi:MAG: site-specific integrase [Candidatus Competibacteraceae bacterium]|nr:MAG: site-specific integrase [Candidatus Competibacteraceae bacterium]